MFVKSRENETRERIITTIAYKDGVIAYDSRALRGSSNIASDRINKRKDSNGVSFFFAGNFGDIDHLITMYSDRDYTPPESTDIIAFAVENDEIFYTGYCDKEFWKEPVDDYDAIGSGRCHAITALDLGCTPVEAIKMAMKRDAGTGGRVRTFKVKK